MNIRTWLALGIVVVRTLALAQAADAPAPLSPDDARAMHSRGKALKAEAEQVYQREKSACQSRAIAINCTSSSFHQ